MMPAGKKIIALKVGIVNAGAQSVGVPFPCRLYLVFGGRLLYDRGIYKAEYQGQEGKMSKNYRAELVGVFGNPVDENPTGVMEEAAFEALGLPFRYLTIRVRQEDLADAVKALRAFGMRGINLTIPHKIAVIPYLDRLTQAAEIIGAVNTVINEKGTLIGTTPMARGCSSPSAKTAAR